MSEAVAPDPDIALLDRVAALDMAAAEHVHAKLLAAEDVGEISEFGRTYQRMTRSLRQTLALKAKLKRDAAAERSASQARPARPPSDPVFNAKIDRIGQLQNALARVAGAAGHDEVEGSTASSSASTSNSTTGWSGPTSSPTTSTPRSAGPAHRPLGRNLEHAARGAFWLGLGRPRRRDVSGRRS